MIISLIISYEKSVACYILKRRGVLVVYSPLSVEGWVGEERVSSNNCLRGSGSAPASVRKKSVRF